MSNHAYRHWLRIQADIAVDYAFCSLPIADWYFDSMDGGSRADYERARDHALKQAATSLREAAIFHKLSMRMEDDENE